MRVVPHLVELRSAFYDPERKGANSSDEKESVVFLLKGEAKTREAQRNSPFP